MAYSRPDLTPAGLEVGDLERRLVGIGFNLAVDGEDVHADIEETLVLASVEGLIRDDLRVLALLTTWMGVHHTFVNVARLRRALEEVDEERVLAYWASVGSWLSGDKRYAQLTRLYAGQRIDLLSVGTEFQIKRRGEDSRFDGAALRVPAGVLRDRAKDVRQPESLASRHMGYRNRVRMGASWRADVWTVLERDPDCSPSDAARAAKCSFAVAWAASRDFRIWAAASAR